jgi:hypothetical protein
MSQDILKQAQHDREDEAGLFIGRLIEKNVNGLSI